MKTNYEDIIKMIEMRKKGATYAEIGKAFGVSRQAVTSRLTYKRKNEKRYGFNIETIIYRGIYEHFKKERCETISSFAYKIYGCTAGSAIVTIRSFMTGVHNSRFTIRQIQKMCEITGMSFEETFALREGVLKADDNQK